MAGTRYVRDEIISQGLDLASSPTVSQHDMPGGVVQPNAYAIKWLQNALDMFHRQYPFASDIVTATMTIPVNADDIYVTSLGSTGYLPTDFILDMRNGLFVSIGGRNKQIFRKSFQYWLPQAQSMQNTPQQSPSIYAIANNRIKIAPRVSTALSGTLYYYQLATALGPNDACNFPDEWTLIEFIRLKALEWTRAIEPGTAQNYFSKQLAGLRSSGLLNEPEYEDGIPIENNQSFTEGMNVNRNTWMGSIAI